MPFLDDSLVLTESCNCQDLWAASFGLILSGKVYITVYYKNTKFYDFSAMVTFQCDCTACMYVIKYATVM